jgi:hypothetical protein
MYLLSQAALVHASIYVGYAYLGHVSVGYQHMKRLGFF